MNAEPGMADPHNAVVPFGWFERLHFARLVMLDDALQADLRAHGVEPRACRPASPSWATATARPTTCSPSWRARRPGPGAHLRALRRLRRRYRDLLAWMRARKRRSAASYVNWVGRTVRQIREEARCTEPSRRGCRAGRWPRRAMPSAFDRELRRVGRPAKRRRASGPDAAGADAARLAARQARATWWSCRWSDSSLLPLLIVGTPLFVVLLRRREKRDPEVCPRPAAADLEALHELEDHDITNQYTAIGAVKPGLFRRWLAERPAGADSTTPAATIYTRGFLARVQTIHFARWVFFDDRRRVLFASNYDGSLESYMDDFINKVGWGLNLRVQQRRRLSAHALAGPRRIAHEQ